MQLRAEAIVSRLGLATKEITPVQKGWSSDQKFRVQAYSGPDALLRIRAGGSVDAHRLEYEFIQALYDRGLAVPRPRAFGMLGDTEGSYQLLDWVEGTDLEEALPALPPEAQYALGQQAGRLLRGIHHTPPIPGAPPPKDEKARALSKTARFEEMGLDLPGAKQTADFIRSHTHWLGATPMVSRHGDFHPGNLIYSHSGGLIAIDFNRWDIGEAAEEFYKLQIFTTETSLPFARGQLDGYFDGPPDTAFWQSLSVHVAIAALHSICWAVPFGPEEVAGMVRRFEQAYADYEGFTRVVPRWYEAS